MVNFIASPKEGWLAIDTPYSDLATSVEEYFESAQKNHAEYQSILKTQRDYGTPELILGQLIPDLKFIYQQLIYLGWIYHHLKEKTLVSSIDYFQTEQNSIAPRLATLTYAVNQGMNDWDERHYCYERLFVQKLWDPIPDQTAVYPARAWKGGVKYLDTDKNWKPIPKTTELISLPKPFHPETKHTLKPSLDLLLKKHRLPLELRP